MGKNNLHWDINMHSFVNARKGDKSVAFIKVTFIIL